MSLMLMRGEILFLKRFYFSKQSASSNISRIFSLRFRIFLFLKVIFGVLGLRCGERAVSRDGGRGLFSGGARGGGGSCCGAWALGAPALAFVARRLSSCDPRVGRWIPNHRPARGVPGVLVRRLTCLLWGAGTAVTMPHSVCGCALACSLV